MENLHERQPSADHLDQSNKNKRSILFNKTFLINIVDKKVSSKVEKLIHLYGGKIRQVLEKNIDYLISDYIQHNLAKSNCKRNIEILNMSSSRHEKSIDIFKKAKLMNIHILTAKQFQHWLKSLLKKSCGNNSNDKISKVLRGKVSLKIESLDQGQCPVFEFIPKWPDLGDTLCKKKPKIPLENNFNRKAITGDGYFSDHFSTSEVGGMCELCDVPFMNYKEHINTKIHIRESLDESKFHELDQLINQRPLNDIFNQCTPEKKISEDNILIQEKINIKNCTENTVINILDTDSDDTNIRLCSAGRNHSTFEKHTTYFKKKCSESNISFLPQLCSVGGNSSSFKKHPTCFKRKFSESNISFVPQKRPSNLQLTSDEETNYYHKRIKRKHKTHQKSSSKQIYKVEVVEPNKTLPNLKNSNKPPVVIRLKRVQHTKNKYSTSNFDSSISIPTDCWKVSSSLNSHTPDRGFIRVVRKPSVNNDKNVEFATKCSSKKQIFTFEHPELRTFVKKVKLCYPISVNIPDTKSSLEYVHERISRLDNRCLKRAMSFSESIQFISNVKPQQIGEWFYNIPKKIEDDFSFDTTQLTSLIEMSKASKKPTW